MLNNALVKYHCENRYKRAPTEDNRIAFNTRRTILGAKRSSLVIYVSTITRSTSVTRVRKKIRAISGTSESKPVICIGDDGELTCNLDEIADTLAARYVEVSNTESNPLNSSPRKMKSNMTLASNVKGIGRYIALYVNCLT